MKIDVDTLAKADIATVWTAYVNPDDIVRWNHASDDWHSPGSRVDLREGGRFSTRMEARDGSAGFDFAGTYTRVVPNERIDYRMDDGREVGVRFAPEGDGVRVRVSFDPDAEYPHEAQQQGWQSILDISPVTWKARAGPARRAERSHRTRPSALVSAPRGPPPPMQAAAHASGSSLPARVIASCRSRTSRAFGCTAPTSPSAAR